MYLRLRSNYFFRRKHRLLWTIVFFMFLVGCGGNRYFNRYVSGENPNISLQAQRINSKEDAAEVLQSKIRFFYKGCDTEKQFYLQTHLYWGDRAVGNMGFLGTSSTPPNPEPYNPGQVVTVDTLSINTKYSVQNIQQVKQDTAYTGKWVLYSKYYNILGVEEYSLSFLFSNVRDVAWHTRIGYYENKNQIKITCVSLMKEPLAEDKIGLKEFSAKYSIRFTIFEQDLNIVLAALDILCPNLNRVRRQAN